MPDREWKRVPDHRSDVLTGSLPQGLPAQSPPLVFQSCIKNILEGVLVVVVVVVVVVGQPDCLPTLVRVPQA